MKNRLAEIFESQTSYLLTLRPIYEANNFSWHSDFPYDLNERWAQEGFRLLAWRIVEEVYEALEVWSSNLPTKTVEDYREEVADVLHFFVELCICADVSPGEICSGVEGFLLDEGTDSLGDTFTAVKATRIRKSSMEAWSMFIASIANTMMELRQRPWRTDNRLTDRARFVSRMAVAWSAFVLSCMSTGITANSLYEAYFGKKVINEKRVADAKRRIPDGVTR